MSSLLRRCTAEAIGTFALVFIGAGSIMSGFFPKSDFGVLGVALAHGLILGTMITATMRISGGHLNPAVTLGLLVARRTDGRTAVAYIVTQVLAAIVAAAALKALYPPAVIRATNLGTPHLAASISLTQGIGDRGDHGLLPGLGGVRHLRAPRSAAGRADSGSASRWRPTS